MHRVRDYTETDRLYAEWRITTDLANGIALDERRVEFYRTAARELRRYAERKDYTPEQVAVAGRSDDCTADTIMEMNRKGLAAA